MELKYTYEDLRKLNWVYSIETEHCIHQILDDDSTLYGTLNVDLESSRVYLHILYSSEVIDVKMTGLNYELLEEFLTGVMHKYKTINFLYKDIRGLNK